MLFFEALLAWVPATMNAVAGKDSRTAPTRVYYPELWEDDTPGIWL